MGRPSTRTSSRLGTGRIQTAKLQSRSGLSSRMGTAAVKSVSSALSLQNLPENYGEKPIFRRLLPNYFLRLQQSQFVQNDLVPNPKLALQYLKFYQQESGSDWFFNDRVARSFYLLKQFEEAEKHLVAAQRQIPREETVLKQINCLACRGLREQCLEMLKLAQNDYPNSVQFKLQAARIFEFQGDWEKALENYQQVLKMQPSCEEGLAGCAALLTQFKEVENHSLHLYQQLLVVKQDANVLNNIAVQYMNDDLYGEAFRYFISALEFLKTSSVYTAQRIKCIKSNIIYNIGCLFCKLNDLQAAQDCFELASRIDQTNLEAVNNLGVLSHMVGQKQKAFQLFCKAEEAGLANKKIIQEQDGDFEGIVE